MAALAREFAAFINATPTPFQLVGVTAGATRTMGSSIASSHAFDLTIAYDRLRPQRSCDAPHSCNSTKLTSGSRLHHSPRHAPPLAFSRCRALPMRRTGGALKPGGKYFFWRNHSTLVAFTIGGKYTAGNGFKVRAASTAAAGARPTRTHTHNQVIGAHTDSPVLKLKPISKKSAHGYLQARTTSLPIALSKPVDGQTQMQKRSWRAPTCAGSAGRRRVLRWWTLAHMVPSLSLVDTSFSFDRHQSPPHARTFPRAAGNGMWGSGAAADVREGGEGKRVDCQ